MFTTLPTGRACGRRVRGGVYAETRLSEDGLPIEYFIVDPPTPVDLDELGLAPVGVQLIEAGGVTHIFDVVGGEFYPYPADYIEETRRLGASRRLPANLDFSSLGPDSRLVLIHARAVLENFAEYPQPPLVACPKGLATHAQSPLPEMCAGLWWHDLGESAMQTPEESVSQTPPGPSEDTETRGSPGHNAAPPTVACRMRSVLRRIEGGTEYWGYPRPEGVVPRYRHGICLSLPISNLIVIQGSEATERNYQAACVSGLPVYLEEA